MNAAQRLSRRLATWADAFAQSEIQEPAITWGVRMAIAGVVPLIWGLATGHAQEGEWIALAAEATCWVELKGGWHLRLRVLLAAGLLAVISGGVGMLAAPFLLWSMLAVASAGFVAALFKNLGERGSGIGSTIAIMLCLANAYPVDTQDAFRERLLLFAIGAAWNLLTGALFSVVLRETQPYRASVSAIWKAVANQLALADAMLDRARPLPGLRERYQKEHAIRHALDVSLALYEGMADDSDEKRDEALQSLAHLRRATGIAAATSTILDDYIYQLRSESGLAKSAAEDLHALMHNLTAAARYCAALVFSRRREDSLLLHLRLVRADAQIQALRNAYPDKKTTASRALISAARLSRLMRQAADLAVLHTDRRQYAAYSSLKASLVLHPRYWWSHASTLARINNHLFRHALRTAVAAGVATWVYQYFEIPAGVWLPFTVLILAQPYFSATLRKSLDRVAGTIGGAALGGVLLLAPASLLLKETALFVSSVLMVRYARKQYAIATAFLTLNLMLTFSVTIKLTPELLLLRPLLTAAGAVLALMAGFALPAWEKKYLPRHIAEAFVAAQEYYLRTAADVHDGRRWLQYKRRSEQANALAFDAYNRYRQESGSATDALRWHELLMAVLHLTRTINAINVEAQFTHDNPLEADQAARLHAVHAAICDAWPPIVQALRAVHPRLTPVADDHPPFFIRPNAMTNLSALAAMEDVLATLAGVAKTLGAVQG